MIIQSLQEWSDDLSVSHQSIIKDHCQKLASALSNRTNLSYEEQLIPISFIQLLFSHNFTLDSLKTFPECTTILTHLISHTNQSETGLSFQTANDLLSPSKHSKSLITFVILIAFVSFISIIGNLCLVKVLYSKRHHWNQTDRIVTCLALSELCLVLLDSPIEIYRLLTPSFSQKWLCPSHTFCEAFFSSSIIFYHLLGALDRFVYIHSHTSLRRPFWSRWFRRLSSKRNSMFLLILPIIFSFPLAMSNIFYTNVIETSSGTKICIVQYGHGILIGLLISFYLVPLLFSFLLHGKLIYFIRSRHSLYYLTPTTYVVAKKSNEIMELQSTKRGNRKTSPPNLVLLTEPKRFLRRPMMMTTTEILPSTTTTMMPAIRSARINRNPSINSSHSSRSSNGTNPSSTASRIILYKINSQANANANRTVLLLVLLLSFYVFCWAPYNIYTWRYAYLLTQSSMKMENRSIISMNESRRKFPLFSSNNFQSDLRRIIYVNYSLYLLSMISMCFSFIFYFSLNKQARYELSSFIGCICPWLNSIRKEKTRQIPYNHRRPSPPRQYSHRINHSPSSLFDEHLEDPPRRKIFNYGCQIQCCP